MVAELVDGRAPALLWLGCSPAPETAGRLMTRGFYPLLGGEIEVASTALAQEVAFEVALALAAEILAFGESPAENETIEFDARTAFHVGYRQGGDEGAISCYRADTCAAPERRGARGRGCVSRILLSRFAY